MAVGIDFGRRHLRVVLASLSYHVIAEESVLLPLGHHADEGIDAAVALLDKLLADSGVERSAVVGAGVGIPGPIDRRTGTVAQGAILPEWVGINILEHLEKHAGVSRFSLIMTPISARCPRSPGVPIAGSAT